MRKTTTKRILLIIGGTIGAVFFLLVIGVVAVIVMGISSKASAPRSMVSPQRPTEWATPIPQVESHTCGYLSLAAAYEAYGLSADDKNIRFRLGVDRAAHPFDEHSTGTLHPDLFRVLHQDGFSYAVIDPALESAAARICDHLDSEHMAMLLIQRRQNMALHWVLADNCSNERIRIVDSLEAEPYYEPFGDFLENHVVSAVLIDTQRGGSVAPHRDGTAEMNQVRIRIADRQAPRVTPATTSQ